MSELGRTEKWRCIGKESVRIRATDIDPLRAQIMIYAQIS